MEFIRAKSILSKLKHAPDSWFGITYNMNIYRGCQHQCIYCDSHSECYQIADFSNIHLKENAIELLETELKKKKFKGTIGTGSMNDPYMPIEKEMGITREALKVISKYKYPVHVITKSNLVLRDIDILQQISKTYAAVSITITAASDSLTKVIEPGATLSSQRFKAIQTLAENNIYCGVLLMPVLPFITDSVENITAIIEQAKNVGAKYIIGAMGMTLRDRQREYYYQKLDAHFPGLKPQYIARYSEQYSANVPDYFQLNELFKAKCTEVGIPTQMHFFNESKPEQLSLF